MEYLDIAKELLEHENNREIGWEDEIGPGGAAAPKKTSSKQKPPEPEPEPDQNQEKRKSVFPAITNLGDVEPEDVNFLWDPYLPVGKLTILEGDPGLGKTFLALNICTIISNGWPLPGPDGRPSAYTSPGNILFMTAEDGLADTLAPRLEKMGADRSKIYCLTGWRTSDDQDEVEQAFTLADVNILRAALEEVRPVLVVIDPLQAYIGGVDMHRANETRPLLAGLAKLAEEFNCAVLTIRHLSKGGAKALYRGLGSIDFTAAARSVLLVGQEPETEKKAMAHVKSSLAKNGPTLCFDISDKNGFMWTGISTCNAEDLLAPPPIRDEKEGTTDSQADEAVEFLYQVLSDGPLESKEIKKQAKEADVKWRTVQRAKEQINFKAFKKGKIWYWPQLTDKTSAPHSGDGADGALPASLTAADITGTAPSAPNGMSGTLEQGKIVEWDDIGTEINLEDMPF